MAANQWESWVAAVRNGDEQASQEFWNRYARPLIRLTEHNLQQRLRRRVDAEDVVQSAFRTAFRRLQEGQFELNSDDQLWKLLCAITLNKTRRQARRHTQQARTMDREVYADNQDIGRTKHEPTPAEAVCLVDLVEQVIEEAKDDEHRQVLCLKLDGYTNGEIAAELAKSERTVRRITEQLRETFDRLLKS
jgi:RNA polymerase sigma-70 factor (ECF subfamily)